MDVFESIRSRRSIRSYRDKSIEDEKLWAVLEAGRSAPSASNRQDWRMIVVRDQETRGKLAVTHHNHGFIADVPVVIVACGTNPSRIMVGGKPACAIDVAIAIDHMTLAATALGLGTCWMGAYEEGPIKKLLGVPDEVDVVVLLALGYPAESPPPRPRRPFDDVVCFDRWT